MKLLLCLVCTDVRKLQLEVTRCQCGKSYGFYLPDHHTAAYGGPARVMGLGNGSLTRALACEPHEDGADLAQWWRDRPTEAGCAPLCWFKPRGGERLKYLGDMPYDELGDKPAEVMP